MKKKLGSRLLSTLLALTMMLGYLGFFAPVEAEAAAVVEYATPATQEELDAVPEWFSSNNGAGSSTGFIKIINGTVYVWGSNTSYTLGITSYTDLEGNVVPVANGTVVPVPTAIPASAFNNEKITRVYMTYYSVMALTVENHIYIWGSYLGGALGLGSCPTPTLLDTSNIGNNRIVDFKHTGFLVYIKTENGTWYTCGSGYSGTLLHGATLPKVPTAIPESTIALIDNKQIADMHGQYQTDTVLMTTDGLLYGFGSPCASHGVGIAGTFVTTAARLSETDTFRGLKFKFLQSEDQAYAAIDEAGDVYAWGTSPSGRLGNITKPNTICSESKIFDHNVYQKKAVYVNLSYNRTVILCDDNTVYAMGANGSGEIIPGSTANVTKPTQIFQDLSQDVTIVGVFATHSGIMAITKSGDMFFAGDNSLGAAGNGGTTNTPGGGPVSVTSPTMPPSIPLTKNLVSYELEIQEDNKTAYYRPTIAGGGIQYTKTVGTSVTQVSNITVDAGSNFKLNVYFEDFGKINTFVMPIRFNPNYLEVVNGNGKAYSRNSEVITPGSLGPSVGIEQCFTVQDWLGGSLAVGTKDGTYPKISNADGWVSVAGYSADANPIIKDRVKMFSISFRARTTVTGNGIAFDFATDENNSFTDGQGNTTNLLGYGYDVTCNGLEHYTAYWSIYNSSGDGGESGYYEFKTEPFPKFNSKLVILRALGMNLTYGATNTVVDFADPTEDKVKYTPSWVINWANKNVTYTINALPYSDAAKTKPGASFPQVTWTFDKVDIDGSNNRDRAWSDFITLVDTEDTFVKFKINPAFTPITDEDDGYIRVTATSQSYTGVSATYYICLRSFAAPDVLELAQKDSSGALVRLPDNAEKTYHYKNDASENYQFFVDFNNATNNTEVVWTLLDKDGDAIDVSDPTAKVTLTKNSDGSATVEPRYTTTGDDYVVLRVESLYDENKFDEVKIKVQLYATLLGFKPETIRMAVMKDGVPSTVDLSKFLSVQPVDVYATNYSWAIVDTPERAPANADKFDPVAGNDVTYGTMGSGSTAAVFTAFEYATPVPSSDGSELEEFVTVRVTENLSGKTADVKIAIMDLNSPIGIDDFAATNNLGTANDTVFIKQGLQIGDKIAFYPSYEDAQNKNKKWSETTIVEGMAPYFTFVVGDRSQSLMKGEGGFLAVVLTRQESGGEVIYDPVPVSYSAEPSLVDGYIHLFGKNTGSIADKDIRVDLEGLNFKETVYTNSAGYFKFTKYIAPGTYNMVVSKKNYLTRRMEPNSSGVGGIEIAVNEDGEFHISTDKNPILLFPGELTNDNAITVQDINYYVQNWVGQYDGNITDFDLYDFLEDNLISAKDLELLLMRKDWQSGSYPVWNVPSQR